MIESRTHYLSLSPILRNLKKFDMENFPLQAEIVYAKSTQEMPNYLKDVMFQTRRVCPPMTKSGEAETEKDKSEATKELSNNLASEVSDFKEQKAMDALPFSASIFPPWITDASRTKIRNVLLKKKANSKPEEYEFHEENEKPDDCTVTTQFKSGIKPNKVDTTFLSNTCGDQMDTDPILENPLHTKLLSNTEVCPDIEESTSIVTSSTSPSIAGTSRDAHNLPTQKRHSKRTNVKWFLESTSKSLLEVSQREALVHALENRLAVIQGE